MKLNNFLISIILISFLVMSVGSVFAADDANLDVVNLDDSTEDIEVAIDDSVVNEDDGESVLQDESPVVTKENFHDYFDDKGSLTSDADELVFEGDFSNLDVSNITINRDKPVTFIGKSAIFKNTPFIIKQNGVTIDGFNFTTDEDNQYTRLISIVGLEDDVVSDINLCNNNIVFIGPEDKEAYAIYAGSSSEFYAVSNLCITNNTITYVGKSDGYNINNVIRVKGNVSIKDNKFDIKMPSCDVGWSQVGDDWVSAPITEGIVIEDSDSAVFEGNVLNLEYTTFSSTGYGTIYAIDFKNSKNAIISSNDVKVQGKDYIYGLILTGDDFIIRSNNITSYGDYYANGIDLEGPASGIVENNAIAVYANTSVYAIYSGMNGQKVKAVYKNNNITGNAYNIFAMSIGDVESELVSNRINITGNYTTGIAYRGNKIVISNNIISLNSSEIGNEDIWEGFGVETVGIKVIQGNAVIENNSITSAGTGISLKSDSVNADLKNNTIAIFAHFDKDAYAVYTSEISRLNMTENTITYSGATNGTGKNEALSIDAASAIIKSNKFDLDLVSIPINWVEEPAGSYNYVGYVFSEGICIEDSESVVFDSNDVKVNYNNIVGYLDNIYAIHFKNADNAVISNNNITALGNSYIYGIVITSNNFTIDSNNISSIGNYYAAGIDVEGPSNGLISYNYIFAYGDNSYPIYSGMNLKPVSVDIINNDINGGGYYVVGMELGGNKATVVNNNVSVEGNYTIGIASDVSDLTVTKNNITSEASNVGNQTIYDYMGGKTLGIKVNAGKAVISENNINTTGDFAVDLTNTQSTVKNNTIQAKNKTGDDAVTFNLKTSFVISTPVTVLLTNVKSGYYYNIVLKDEHNNVMAKTAITVNGKTFTTNDKGAVSYKVSASKIGTQTLTIKYAGAENYNPATATAKINIVKEATKLTASKKTFKAKVKTKKYTVTLKNSKSKAVKGLKLTLKVKGKTYKATTNAKGKATFKITKLTKKGKYTAKIKFAGNGLYKAASKSVKITVKK